MKLKDISKKSLHDVLSKLNIKLGDIVFVASNDLNDLHISERNLFINNLIDYLGDEGTIIMDLSGANFDPRFLKLEDQLKNNDKLRSLMPAYSKNKAYLYAKDSLALSLLLNNKAVISNSYTYPYIGVGKYAKLICQSQSLDFPNGSMSPLARLYELRAKAILINPYVQTLKLNNYVFETSHKSAISINGGSILKNNKTIWKKFLEKEVDEGKLKTITNNYDYKRLFYQQKINKTDFMTVEVRNYVDYCRKYI